MRAAIDYPLFDAALERFARRPIEAGWIADVLTAEGLRVEVEWEESPVVIRKERWLGMVRDRYMSLLERFDDAELDRGIAEIDERRRGEVVEFADRWVFVVGSRD